MSDEQDPGVTSEAEPAATAGDAGSKHDTADPAGDLLAGALPSLGPSADDALAAVRAGMGLAEQPREIGDYRVLGRLGAGAMGVVYLAQDDRLGRKVAIKLLASSRRSAAREERLIREARGLARLQHPNVITVHEVGRHRGAVYLAMEYAPGGDLATWLADGPRKPSEVLRLFREAGEGLAAAHDQGLVHRDFKPANVLLDAHARAKVADFGLVRATDDVDLASEDGLGPADEASSQGLTRTGAMIGTPAYMAPEVALGAPADARSDQFSFCVALYEALAGVRPFAGESLVAITLSIQRGELRPPARGHAVGRGLLKILRRGLAQDPGARFPDMHALVHALARRSRRPMVAATVALVGVGALAGVLGVRAQADPCDQGPARIAEVWNDGVQDQIRAAFARAKLPYGASLQASVLGELERYAAAWARGHRDACEDTRVLGEQSEAAMDVRMACLGRRRRALEQATKVLTQASSRQLARAHEVASGLAPISTCEDAAWLQAHDALPDDPRRRARVEELETKLAASQARFRSGDLQGAEAGVEAIAPGVEEVGWPQLRAKRDLLRAQILIEAGKLDDAEAVLRTSLAEALASGADETAAWVATTGVHLAATRQRDAEAAHTWQWLAEPLAARLPTDRILQASMILNQANALLVEGKLEASIELRERGIARLGEALGEDHPRVAEQRVNLAASYRRRGDVTRAIELLRGARDDMERALGGSHPSLGKVYNNLGTAHLVAGDLDAAQAAYARSLEIKRASLPEGHPSLGHAYNNLGEVFLEKGQTEDARASLERAEEIWRKALGDLHPLVTESLVLQARTWEKDGRHARAATLLREALLERVAQGGASAARLAWALAQILDEHLKDRPGALRCKGVRGCGARPRGREGPGMARRAGGREAPSRSLKAAVTAVASWTPCAKTRTDPALASRWVPRRRACP